MVWRTFWPQLLRRARERASGQRWPAPLSERGGSEGSASGRPPAVSLDHACIHVATSQPLEKEKEKEGHFRAKRRGKVLVEWLARREGGARERTRTGAMRAMRVSNRGKISILPSSFSRNCFMSFSLSAVPSSGGRREGGLPRHPQ